MAATGFCHHIATLLLLAATVLLLITTISAPVVNNISILRVELTNSTKISFGTFGFCFLNPNDQDVCTGSHIGYSPANVMSGADGTKFNVAASDSANALTNAMVLHPIACGLAFIAFLLNLGSGIIGALFASIFAFIAWVVTLVIMAIDFALFGIIRDHVNDDGSGSRASYSVGMWTCMAAMICLFLGMFMVLFTCCSARRHRRMSKSADPAYNTTAAPTTTRRRFWQRRTRY